MMQHIISLLPERLLTVRKQTGASQVDFATRLGVSPRAYKNYELGLRDVPLSLIESMHRELGTDLSWLILGEGASNSETAQGIIRKIVFGIRTFEDTNGNRLSKEKTATVFTYLFSQMSNGRDFSEADMHAYLETTL
ncbi:MAG: hypothetical protein CSA68_11285 [Rhodobacterales bacterium]|nr:MAG: hypothetical protein CSA68_11285 [Rhodobacterales bacterium]